MASQLVQSIRTTFEAKDLTNRLCSIKDGLSKSLELEELLNHHLTASEKHLLLLDLAIPHGSKNKLSSQTARLADIIKTITALPVMTMETAITPSVRLTHLIADKLANAFPGIQILIETKVKAGLVGGAVFCFKGRRYDYSLAKKMKNENF